MKQYLNIYTIVAGIVGVLTLIEGVKFLLPYYSYRRFLAFLIGVLCIKYIYTYRRDLGNIPIQVKNIGKKISRHRFFTLIQKHISTYRDIIVYSTFFIMVMIMCVSLVFNTGSIFYYSVIIFYVVFFLGKILGFEFPKSFPKTSFSDTHVFRFFLITTVLYYGFLMLMTQSFGVSGSTKILYVGGLLGMYIVLGLYLFFHISGTGKTIELARTTILRPYNILMGCLACMLIGYIGFQNFGGSTKNLDTAPLVVREPGVPGVISDEAYLDRLNNPESFVETVFVYELYTLSPGIQLGSITDGVTDLQEVLQVLEYYDGEVTGSFDENTQNALINTLRTECEWPESTRGIFGPQAKECIDNLEIPSPEVSVNPLAAIISDEVQLENTSEDILSETVEEIVTEEVEVPEEVQEEATNEELIVTEEAKENSQEIEEVAVDSVPITSISTDASILVTELYDIEPGIELGDSGEDVSSLQEVLQVLEYYQGDITGNFDIVTQEALIDSLKSECAWPETTRGIFGPLAKICIDNLFIPIN